MKKKAVLLFVVLVVLLSGIAAASEVNVESKKIAAAPVFDGILSAGEWGTAPAITLKDPAEYSDGSAEWYFRWDENYFYYAVKVSDNDIYGTHNEDGGAIWGDDSCSLFLDIKNVRDGKLNPSVYQLVVGVAGAKIGIVGNEDGEPVENGWNSGAEFVFKTEGTLNNPDDEDSGYTVECRIPWSAFGMERYPDSETKWGINLIVYNISSYDDWSALCSSVDLSMNPYNTAEWGIVSFR